MSKLIMCKGLPGSGKSTWAADQIEQSYRGKNPMTPATHAVVNKDSIRRELEASGWTWSRENEKEVERIRDNQIRTYLRMNLTVISDDTNLAPKHEKRLRELALDHLATFEIKSFLDVPLEECIRRDSLREGKAKVGEQVIKNMYDQYLNDTLGKVRPAAEPQPMVPYVPDPTLPRVVLCDLDGTAAIHNGRGPFDYHKIPTDLVNKPVKDILWAMHNSGVETVYLSGREDCQNVKANTLAWLLANNFPPPAYHKLYMRAAKDFRKDSVVKYELFNNHIRPFYYVQFVLDDRDQVVKMWRDLGLTCLQVAYGNF